MEEEYRFAAVACPGGRHESRMGRGELPMSVGCAEEPEIRGDLRVSALPTGDESIALWYSAKDSSVVPARRMAGGIEGPSSGLHHGAAVRVQPAENCHERSTLYVFSRSREPRFVVVGGTDQMPSLRPRDASAL